MKLKNRRWLFTIIAFVLVLGAVFLGGTIYHKSKQRHVPVAMALDDGYLYPTVVSITSMMENKSGDTVYDYYIMHPEEFSENSKTLLKSLGKKYKKCNINLIDMGQKYKNANDKGHITTPAYYRLSLSELLPNLDKILWIDGDTLVLDDLQTMLETDVSGLYYRGFLDDTVDAADSFGVYNDHCICDGVMVVNLAELRKDDMVNKFQKFIEENNEKLVQHDQTVVNVVCVGKIDKLNPRYGMFNYYYETSALRKYYELLRTKEKYTMEELLAAREHPVIVHCVNKPWKSKGCGFFNEWWDYAKKTDCYEEIAKKYSAVLE